MGHTSSSPSWFPFLPYPSTLRIFSSLQDATLPSPGWHFLGAEIALPSPCGPVQTPALTLMVTFPLVILRMLKPTVGIMSSLNCPD